MKRREAPSSCRVIFGESISRSNPVYGRGFFSPNIYTNEILLRIK